MERTKAGSQARERVEGHEKIARHKSFRAWLSALILAHIQPAGETCSTSATSCQRWLKSLCIQKAPPAIRALDSKRIALPLTLRLRLGAIIIAVSYSPSQLISHVRGESASARSTISKMLFRGTRALPIDNE